MPKISFDLAVNLLEGNIKEEMKKINKSLDVNQQIAGWERILSISKKLYGLTNSKRHLSIIGNAHRELNTLREVKSIIGQQAGYENMLGKNVSMTNNSLSSQGGIMRNLVSVFRKYISLFTVVDVAKKIAETTGYFEQQQVALEGILGSASEAQKAITRIKALALESPFQTKDLVAYTKQLSAYGIESDKLVDTMKSLADISAGLGVDMGRVILAYGQVKSASVLRGQELRQFTEAGIPMVQALADKFTQLNGKLVTTGEVFELISKRKVPFEMVADVLRDMTAEGGKFYKMQENLTDTLYGQIQKLKDVWVLSLNEVGNAINPILGFVVQVLQKLSQKAHGIIAASGIVTLVAGVKAAVRNWDKFTASITSSRRALLVFNERLSRTYAKIKAATGAANKFKVAWAGLGGVMKAAWSVLASPVGALALFSLISMVTNAIAKWKEYKRELNEIDASFAKQAEKQKQGLDDIIGRLSVAKRGTKEYNETVNTLKANYGQFASGAFLEYLSSEQKALHNTALSWAEVAENIKKAIDAENDYKRNNARAEHAGEKAQERATEGKWYLAGYSKIEELIAQISAGTAKFTSKGPVGGREFVGKFANGKDEKANRAITAAMESFFASKSLTGDEFKEYLKKSAKQYSPEVQKELVDISDAIFETFARGKEWEDYKAAVEANNNTNRAKNRKEFENARKQAANRNAGIWNGTEEERKTKNEKSTSYDPFSWYRNEDRGYLNAAVNRINDIVKQIGTDSKLKGFGDAYSILKKELEKEYSAGKTKDVSEAIYNLANKIDDSDLKSEMVNVADLLIEFAGTKSGVAAKISENIERDFGKGEQETAEKKEYFARYNPDDSNVEQFRNQLQDRYTKIVQEIESHGNEVGEAWKEQVEELKKEKQWIKELASERYYDFALKDPKGYGRNKHKTMKIANFFDDVLALIIKADDASKKVAGITGWTESMTGFFQNLSDDNYMKQFFMKGGKPFDKFFQNLQDYGVTEFLPEGFDVQNIETIFRNAGWEEGKQFTAPDFEAMYENILSGIGEKVLENLKKKAKAYGEGTTERNSIESQIVSMENLLANGIKTLETRWGRDEIQKKLDAAIKSLRDISTNVDTIREQRKYFDSVSNNTNFLKAQKLIYGNYAYERDNDVNRNENYLKSTLGSDAGKGLASTNAGTALLKLLESGSINISSLEQLLDIQTSLRKQLGSQYILDEEGNPTDKMVDNNFTESLSFVSDGVNKLVESLVTDFEQLMKLSDNTTKKSDSFLRAAQKYIDAIDRIKDNVERGTIDETEATKKRVVATQNLYDELAGEVQDVIKDFFKEDNGTTGLSKGGFNFMQMFGEGDFMKKFQNQIAKNFAENKAGAEQQLANGQIDQSQFAEQMQGFSGQAAGAMSAAGGTIAMIDMIIKAVYGAIKAIIEMAKHIMEAAEASNHKLRLKREKDGSLIDKDGNIVVDKKYYKDNDRREISNMALDAVGTYNQHVMDGWEKFKSGDGLGALAEIVMSITDLIRDIAGIGDAKLRQEQDELIRSNDRLGRSLDALNHTMQGLAGIERWANMNEQIKNLAEQRKNAELALEKENDMKNGDDKKAQDFADEATKAGREIDDIIRGIQEEIFSTADDVASQLTDPLVDAFRNGENAARSWRNAVRSYIGDVLKEVLMTKVIAPQIDSLLDEFMDGETDPKKILQKFSDPNKAVGLRNDLFSLGDDMIEGFNSLPKAIQEMIAWNSDTTELSGGIQGITEDTARTLEGLSYSMLAQLVLIQRSVMNLEESGFANVQLSWFTDMLNQQRALRQAADSINSILSGSYDGVRSLRVTME